MPDFRPEDPAVTTELFTLDFVAKNFKDKTKADCVRNAMQHMLAGAYITGIMGRSSSDVWNLGIAWEIFEVYSSKSIMNATDFKLPIIKDIHAANQAELKNSLSADTLLDMSNDLRGADIGNKIGGDIDGIVKEIAHQAECDCNKK